MKGMMIAFFAAALIAAAPAVLARSMSSKAPHQHHRVSGKHVRSIPGYATRHAMHAKGSKTSSPEAFGSARPSEPKDQALENSRQAGGGGM